MQISNFRKGIKVVTSMKESSDSVQIVRQLADEMEAELVSNIIPFWLKLQDHRGGFHSYVNSRGERGKDAPKGALLNSRILWFFSRTARELAGRSIALDCYQAAEHAFKFLKEKLLDHEFGGVYWSVDAQGQPLDRQKHIYNQSFAIYGLTEWYALSKDVTVLELIDNLYGLIERTARDHNHRGYQESFDRRWESIPNDLVCDTEDVVSDKSMNTHLHIMEAYSRLYEIHPSQDLKTSLIELIQLMCVETQDDRFSFCQFFTRDWQVQSLNHSFGHDIEGAWLIWEAAQKVLEGSALEEVRNTVLAMTDSVLELGIDHDGAVYNEWIENKYVDTSRIWWVQAEAIVGFMNAWQMTQNTKYLNAATLPWSVLKTMVIDHENGEWHWESDRWGNVKAEHPKVSFWKCPYHNGRACLEIISRARG